MSYGLKYTGTLNDYFDRTVEVNIYENDYSGSDSILILAGISKTMNGSDEDLFVGKIGSSISVGVVSDTNFKYVDLFTGDARKYKLEIKINSIIDWVGWVVPELFTEPYDTPPYITTISARDGLAELSSRDFELEGVKTHIDILSHCLGNLGELNINESINIYEENHSIILSPLVQTYTDCERYEGLTCEDVVIDLINLWGARLYQSDGEWWFVNIMEYQNVLNYRKFNYEGVLQSTSTKDIELLIGRPQEDKFANTDQQLNILPGWKEIVVNANLLLKDSAIINGDFELWNQVGTVFTPENWVESTAGVIARSVDSSSDYSAFFTMNNSSPASAKFITQTIENFVPSGYNNLFSISYKNINYIGTVDFWVKIEMWDGASDFRYLQDDGTWTTTESYIEFENVESKAAQNAAYQTYTFATLAIPITGKMFVYIYGSTNGNLLVDDFKFELLQPTWLAPYKPENQNVHRIGNFTTVVNVDLLTSDFPDNGSIVPGYLPSGRALNEQHAYIGGLYLNSAKSQVTQRWQLKSIIDLGNNPFKYANRLDYMVANSRGQIMVTPKWAISGTILAKNIKFDSGLIDYQINNKKYLVCNGNYDMENCLFNGTYIEIGTYSGGEWILEDGTWNDDGIWDDSNTWND